jgi:hypothetical protein
MIRTRIIKRIAFGISAFGLLLLAIASIEHVAPDPWPRIMLIAGMVCTIIGVLLRRMANRMTADPTDESEGR